MPKLVLGTGGAGFIGSHVTHRALAFGFRVRARDDLPVHDAPSVPPGAMNRRAVG
jgi:nucleoside-diphosphate-sugar epimerase